MTREEVKIQFTGLAHDHLMASNRMHSHTHNNMNQRHQQQHQRNNSNSHLTTMNNHHNMNNSQNYHNQNHNQQQQPTHINISSNHSLQSLDGCLNATKLVNGPPTPPPSVEGKQGDASALSTIAILRRHPMYDSLVLVKKWRPCLNGYSLEFPTSTQDTAQGQKANGLQQHQSTENNDQSALSKPVCDVGCGRTKLVSMYLDGDDPIYQNQQLKLKQHQQQNGHDQQEEGEVVYVPINGLLHRLDKFDRQGISIDSRVYAFALGLKTAERFLTSSAEKEIQEAPPF